MKNSILSRKSIRYFIIVMLWLTIWQMVSLFVHNSILLVGPIEVLSDLWQKCFQAEFWLGMAGTMLKVWGGFFLAFACGCLLGALSYKSRFLEAFLEPLMAVFKSVPVASFVVLFLIWWESSILSFVICFFVVLPQIYVSLLKGLKAAGRDKLEMAKMYRFHPIDKLHYVYRPAFVPYLESAAKVAAGMAWKSAVAAELIGVPARSIGEGLYMSKIYMDTAGVLSYSLMIVLLSLIFEKIVLFLLQKYGTCRMRVHKKMKMPGGEAASDGKPLKVAIRRLCKNYGERALFADYSADFALGLSRLSWPSGQGKTTLFRLISGLEKADAGDICVDGEMTYLFQEERLCEEADALTNVALACGSKEAAREKLTGLLPAEVLDRPVSTLSGGERRRISLVRALSMDTPIYLLDEPLTGLDEANRALCMACIEEKAKKACVIMALHP